MIRKIVHFFCICISAGVLLICIYLGSVPDKVLESSSKNVSPKDERLQSVYITESSKLKLRYLISEENIKGICIYLDGISAKSNEEENDDKNIKIKGCIRYTIKDQQDTILSKGNIPLSDILSKKTQKEGIEIPCIFDNCQGQLLQIELRADNLSKDDAIWLLGNKNKKSKMVIIKDDCLYSEYPLYRIITEKRKLRDITNYVLLFVLFAAFSILTRTRAEKGDKK